MILIATFLLNTLMLVYFVLQPGLVTDFSQPPQLFALAINSPAAREFAGSCGTGPKGKQYKVKWTVGQDQNHLYIAPSADQDLKAPKVHQTPSTMATGYTNRLFASVSTALGRLNFTAIFGQRRQTNVNSAADTEPLRQADGPQGALSRRIDVELVDVEGEAQEPGLRL